MSHLSQISRRALLLSGCAVATGFALPARAASDTIHVVKGTGCECCTAWADYLRTEGFTVTEEERYGTLLMR